MSSNVIPLASHRRNREHACNCTTDSTCYPHRLVDLAARVEDVRGDVEQLRFCDWGTFERLTSDVLDVLHGIAGECLPDERATR